MGGCGVLDEPCETPEPDPPPAGDEADVVRDFVLRVWNHEWTAAENDAFLTAREAGDNTYVPLAMASALSELRTASTIRHRHDSAGAPIRSSGESDYRICVNRVHEVAQDLHLAVLDLAVAGEIVTAHITMTGVDRRADGMSNATGAFGATRPSGRPFELPITTMYRVVDGKIAEDWLLRRGEPAYGPP
ncbi:ester cyclase [Roseomonas fluvialis]|uniref:SnoaL-like domain-containing protein n=1 Tax=Roseomonas fluvialis TaxID=1750527 RepID=A0ABM7XYH0_9PROT|nr:ester cyclase [Roseomonas fluvialis]BDG70477.1 hypothetical protein Rmf_04060 [Roseomonas fluvialis]